MGLRFQRRLSLLPGARLNLSQRGVSASLGPRGADVNIGREGVTTNAGLPGTGLSWRSRLGTHGSWFGVVLLAAALAFWAGKHLALPQAHDAAPAAAAMQTQVASPALAPATHPPRAPRAALKPGPAFVHRGRSVLRDAPKASGKSLKKEAKGAAVTLLEIQSDGWAKVKDGATMGYMRASVLGMEPPQP